MSNPGIVRPARQPVYGTAFSYRITALVVSGPDRIRVPRRARRAVDRDVWLVGALTALALGLRWACIHQSLFGDELILFIDVHGRSLGQVLSVVHDTEKTPPVYFLLGWLFARGSDADVLVRIPTLIAAVATVPVIYALGVRTVARRGALVAAAWFAISPFELFYGTEARAYAVVTTLVVISTLALLLALEQRRLRWWALYVVAATGAVYTHYIGELVLVPQAVWALATHRDRVREQLMWHALVVLLWLPWLPSFLVQFRHSKTEAQFLAGVAPLTVSNVSKIVGNALVGLPFASLHDLPGWPAIGVLGAMIAGLVVAFVQRARTVRGYIGWLLASRRGMLAVNALFPPAALCLYALRPHTSFLLARNLSVAVPYALLMFGWVLTLPSKNVAVALSTVSLAAVGVGTVKAVTPSYQRPNTRAAAHYLDAHAPSAAPVVDVETISGYDQKPARAVRLYLRRPDRVVPITDWAAAWASAARNNAPLFLTYPNQSGLLVFFTVPPRYASRYRIVA